MRFQRQTDLFVASFRPMSWTKTRVLLIGRKRLEKLKLTSAQRRAAEGARLAAIAEFEAEVEECARALEREPAHENALNILDTTAIAAES